MKKIKLVICFILISFGAVAQKQAQVDQTPEQLFAMGLRNGCSDSQKVVDGQPFNNAYYSIVNNYSISESYRNGYRDGWISCRKGVLNGKAVKENKLQERKSLTNKDGYPSWMPNWMMDFIKSR